MEQLSKISDILNNEVFDTSAYASSIKKAVAFGFWKNICGSRFSDFSVPFDIKGSTLYIAVKNPQVMQELIFCKQTLLDKINNYFLPLNVKITELRYDYKVWKKVTSSLALDGEEPSYYSKKEVEEVSLDVSEQSEFRGVTDTISSLSFLNNDLKEKYKENIINSYKAKKLRAEEENKIAR